jgi:glycosyltransferase involved in cell wall biosynthesis
MLLSICIPTYERTACLNNCLNSIYIAKKNFNFNFEVCISDNASTENTKRIINLYKKKLNIKFKKNKKNLGLGVNIIKAVSMAKGKYSWIIGNDDLLFPFALKKIYNIIYSNLDKDFFYINSANLDSKYVFSYKQPFNTNLIPRNLNTLSPVRSNKSLDFIDLINPAISFDYLLGIFLSIFNTRKFRKNIHILDYKKLRKKETFSTFENTAPHVSVFAKFM